jgi:SAM-dependent methyltransferase
VPGERSFDRCDECDSLRLSPLPSEAELAGFYPPVDRFSRQLEQGGGLRRWLTRLERQLFFGPQYRAQVQQVLQTTGSAGREGLRLLDVGCDRGLRLAAFQEAGLEVVGLDLQPEVIDNLQREFGIPGEVGGVEAMAECFATGSFDIITAFYLLEHVPDVGSVLANCRRLLKPGGWFVGVVPVCDGLQARLFGHRWLHVTEAPRHVSLPSALGLLQAASLAGYASMQIRPDSLLNCAGIIGGSLFPESDLTSAYGRGWWAAIARRILGGICAVAAIPFCLVENYLLGETSHAMLFAQAPATD